MIKSNQQKSNPVVVYSGNEAPVVDISLKGNKTFYFPGKPVGYEVSIQDNDDTATVKDLSNLYVSADYIEGSDKAAASQGHQVVSESLMGKNLIQTLDCKACHKQEGKSVGPAYIDVAMKYQKDPKAEEHLVNKIIKGGSGVWGETAMPAHPGLKEGEARQIISWIQSLAAVDAHGKSLPPTGSVKPTLDKVPTDNGILIISATYTDKGGAGTKPLAANSTAMLRSNKMSFRNAKHLVGYSVSSFNGQSYAAAPTRAGSFSLDSIDLQVLAMQT
jgi:cytochrome c551/c552